MEYIVLKININVRDIFTQRILVFVRVKGALSKTPLGPYPRA